MTENEEVMKLATNLHEKHLAASMTEAIEKARDILEGSKNIAKNHKEYIDNS